MPRTFGRLALHANGAMASKSGEAKISPDLKAEVRCAFTSLSLTGALKRALVIGLEAAYLHV